MKKSWKPEAPCFRYNLSYLNVVDFLGKDIWVQDGFGEYAR